MRTELNAIYGREKSYYGKAHIESESTVLKLISYSTEVATYDVTTSELNVKGWYSATTARHINEFLQQNGFSKMCKKEMEDGVPRFKRMGEIY